MHVRPFYRQLLLALPWLAGACAVQLPRASLPAQLLDDASPTSDSPTTDSQGDKQGDKQGKDELAELRKQAEQAANQAASQTQPESQPVLNLTALNPRVTVFGDFTGNLTDGTLRNQAGDDIGDRFSLREAELDMRADIDPTAKGVAIFSVGEDAPGEYKVDLEEVYARFEALPANLRAKVGRFRTAFGQFNRLHTHDLPQTTRPLAVMTFLGEEGDNESGVSLEYLAPWESGPTVDLTYELVNGENEQVLAGTTSRDFAHVGHVSSFFNLSDRSYMELGGSLMAGKAEATGSGMTYLSGVDLMVKLLPDDDSKKRSFVLHTEGFHLDRSLASGDVHSNGAFVSAIYQFDRNWYLGARGDWTEFNDVDTGHAKAASGWLSYYTSEFLRLRIGYEQLDDPRQPEANGSFYFQMTFVLGAHPPHPYWVNR